MNVIDKIIASVAPVWGLKRAGARKRAELINSGYGNYGANVHKKSAIGWGIS